MCHLDDFLHEYLVPRDVRVMGDFEKDVVRAKNGFELGERGAGSLEIPRAQKLCDIACK